MTTRKPFLVIGATGQQGGAVMRHLLARGAPVRALTRRPAALQITRAGQPNRVEVVAGDLHDPRSLTAAMTGVAGAFLVTTYHSSDPDAETRQGVTAIAAATAARVPHLVFSSVGSADQAPDIAHFATKAAIERHLRASALPHTIVRPVNFMENWRLPMFSTALTTGTITLPLSATTTTQEVAVDDIGALAAASLLEPERWLGRTIELAGDTLDMTTRAHAFSRHLARPVTYQQITWQQFHHTAGAEMTAMFRWFEQTGYAADLTALRSTMPQLTTFNDWLTKPGPDRG